MGVLPGNRELTVRSPRQSPRMAERTTKLQSWPYEVVWISSVFS
jgi:hypothetical protein